jgi:hypothetical protein
MLGWMNPIDKNLFGHGKHGIRFLFLPSSSFLRIALAALLLSP